MIKVLKFTLYMSYLRQIISNQVNYSFTPGFKRLISNRARRLSSFFIPLVRHITQDTYRQYPIPDSIRGLQTEVDDDIGEEYELLKRPW